MGEPVWKLGRVNNVHLGFEDHGFLTIVLMIEGAGWGQGFGQYMLGLERDLKEDEVWMPEHLYRWVRGLLKLFGTRDFVSIQGKQVWMLSNFVKAYALRSIDEERVFWADEKSENQYGHIRDTEGFDDAGEVI